MYLSNNEFPERIVIINTPDRPTQEEITLANRKAIRKIIIFTGCLAIITGGIYMSYRLLLIDELFAKMRGEHYHNYWRYSIGLMNPDEFNTFGTHLDTGEMRPRKVW